jgi:hypothetical protein
MVITRCRITSHNGLGHAEGKESTRLKGNEPAFDLEIPHTPPTIQPTKHIHHWRANHGALHAHHMTVPDNLFSGFLVCPGRMLDRQVFPDTTLCKLTSHFGSPTADQVSKTV